jgi:hypothetical protein
MAEGKTPWSNLTPLQALQKLKSSTNSEGFNVALQRAGDFSQELNDFVRLALEVDP